jgi:hypothetical protein
VDKDIQQYIQQQLSEKKNLIKWNKDAAIRQDIEAAPMSGAREMYVFTQLSAEIKLTIIQVPMGCMSA